MSTVVDQAAAPDAGLSAASQLPYKKRSITDEVDAPAMTPSEPAAKVPKTEDVLKTEEKVVAASESEDSDSKPIKRQGMSKAREIRLEQNRKAARESRRRKKVMIEELQRSVIFFSRANGTLKQQNDELARLLMQAQAQVSAIESQPNSGQQATTQNAQAKPEGQQQQQQQGFHQAQAQAVATQAMYESQGYPAAAARAAAHTMNAGSQNSAQQTQAPAPSTGTSQQSLPPMQPGATMQAMANFQQAAAAAMQAAVQGMQGIPGMAMNTLAAAPAGANPQQAYNDTMTALAMQQAAAAAAGQQFFQGNPFMGHPMMAWQNQQGQQQQQQAAAGKQPAQAPAPQQQPPQQSA
jgi:hypothetical protein